MKPQENQENDNQPLLLERLWRGQLGLPVTYWVYGVLSVFLFMIAIMALETLLLDHGGNCFINIIDCATSVLNPYNYNNGDSWLFLLKIIICPYYYVIYVGTWRAANQYSGNTIYPVLAKFTVICMTIFMILFIFMGPEKLSQVLSDLRWHTASNDTSNPSNAFNSPRW